MIFLVLYFPIVVFGYSIYKYPDFFIKLGLFENQQSLYFLGKHPSFWYSLIYTLIVCSLALKVILSGSSPYKKGKKNPLVSYQRNKFISIFFIQLIFFFIVPYIIPAFSSSHGFFSDPITPVNKNAYIYISRAFTSWGGFLYIFVLVPLSVWFFGKRYCSWFCACGNLAETIGITKWGSGWVKFKTPRGDLAKKMESLQTVFLSFAFIYGGVLFIDLLGVFSSSTLSEGFLLYQEFIVDFIFGALIGVGAYPLFGTRMWCRYGCPLAKFMELFGRYVGSKFKVQAGESCKGLDLCTKACPMGIAVDSYAHKDKKPTLGSFGLSNAPCIGCGGCIDICPVKALSFVPVAK